MTYSKEANALSHYIREKEKYIRRLQAELPQLEGEAKARKQTALNIQTEGLEMMEMVLQRLKVLEAENQLLEQEVKAARDEAVTFEVMWRQKYTECQSLYRQYAPRREYNEQTRKYLKEIEEVENRTEYLKSHPEVALSIYGHHPDDLNL